MFVSPLSWRRPVTHTSRWQPVSGSVAPTRDDVSSLSHSPMNPIVPDSPMVHPSYLRDGIESVHHAKSPLELVRTPLRHLELLRELVRRDVAGRYRGSSLDMIFAHLLPG